MKKQKDQGFSLIEVLVSAFLGSVILLGTGKMVSVSLKNSNVIKSNIEEQILLHSISKVLTDSAQCKANLKPSIDRLTGVEKELGRGTLSSLYLGLDNPDVNDIALLTVGQTFQSSLDIVRIQLTEGLPTDNPKTQIVNRKLIVYYKKRGLKNLPNAHGEDLPCTNSDTRGCYFSHCSLQYALQDIPANPNVTECDVLNCMGITGQSNIAGVQCNSGEYLSGFDPDGQKICKSLGESIGNSIGSCDDDEYLKGFDNMGVAICEITHRNQKCNNGKYLSGFDNIGNKICKTLVTGTSTGGTSTGGTSTGGTSTGGTSTGGTSTGGTSTGGTSTGGTSTGGTPSCGTPTVWSDKCQRCHTCTIRLHGIMTDACVCGCKPGYTLNHKCKTCYQCPEGASLGANCACPGEGTDTPTCPDGNFWSTKCNKCVGNCAENRVFNENSCKCECPSSMTWNGKCKKCYMCGDKIFNSITCECE